MAYMIPDQIRSDAKSPAERRLYEIFRAQLSNEWIVFHHVPWQIRDLQSGAQDGEADFVIAHPDQGILVLEVKGGNIRYDGVTKQWYSYDYKIKDPFDQVRDSKYSLLRLLQEQPYWHSRWVTMGHAVAFPDVVITQQRLRPDATRDIVMDMNQTGDISNWLTAVFRYWRGQDRRDGAPGPAGIRELASLLSPSFTFRPLLSSEIEGEGQELLRLTKQQYYLLDFLGRHRRVAISGCAGSGKTLLALEKARRLSRQGFRVLFTCFNRNLAEFLRSNLTDLPSIHVNHFHGLCGELAHQAGLSMKREQEVQPQVYYDVTLPTLLIEAADKLDWRVDAVIVDEGQDFRENWWISLQCLLHDSDNGILYIFYDDNQNLYQSDQHIPLETAPFSLSENCRNTQSIHDFVQQFYPADHSIIAHGPVGRSVDILRYATADELKRHLRRQLYYLVVEQGVPADEVVVLTPRAHYRSVLWRLGSLGNIQLVDHPTGASGEIFCTTIHQYKGLESPVVILAEIDPDCTSELKKLLYIGASRACNHLVIIVHNTLSLM